MGIRTSVPGSPQPPFARAPVFEAQKNKRFRKNQTVSQRIYALPCEASSAPAITTVGVRSKAFSRFLAPTRVSSSGEIDPEIKIEHQVRDWYSGVAIKMGRRQGAMRSISESIRKK